MGKLNLFTDTKPVRNTVADLIEELQKLDPNTQIGLSSDEEGNNYSPWVYVEQTCNLVILYPSGNAEIDEFVDYVAEELED